MPKGTAMWVVLAIIVLLVLGVLVYTDVISLPWAWGR
jgi:hypothetical protein